MNWRAGIKKVWQSLSKTYSDLRQKDAQIRKEKNQDHLAPNFFEIYEMSQNPEKTGWFLMAPWQNVFHDDSENLPEIKFTHLDGREYIYGPLDNRFNSEYVFKYGSYNHCSSVTSAKGWKRFLILTYKYVAHTILDILPAIIFRS